MLLIHGFPLDHSMWQKQLEGLRDRCRLIAPDLPGFGASDLLDPEVLTMELFAEQLAELLDALEVREPLTVCGLSMGGYIAFAFWRKYAERLRRLILCDTRAAADPPDVAAGRLDAATRVLEIGTSEMAGEMPKKLFADQTFAEAGELVTATADVISRTDRMTVAGALVGMAQRGDMTGELPSIHVPTLVLCGQHDAISSPEEMRGMAEAMPDARFVEIAGAGHMAPLENGPAVNEAIVRFLEERP